MRYRKLDSNDDFTFGNGQEDFYRDVPEAVGQAAKTRLLLWLGEWFLDIEEGTPYMQGILGKQSQTSANVTIQDRVLNTQGITVDGTTTNVVTDIANYVSSIDPDSRGYTATFDLDTIYGPTQVQVENYANY